MQIALIVVIIQFFDTLIITIKVIKAVYLLPVIFSLFFLVLFSDIKDTP